MNKSLVNSHDKKKWSKPQMVILFRGKPEEFVMHACKQSGGTIGPAAGNCAKPDPGCLVLASS
jgi:hypothetical protein